MTNRKRSRDPIIKRQHAAVTRASRRAPNSPPRARVSGTKKEYLDQAQKHVVEGELRVRQQRELVARQAARGDDTGLSERLLARLEEVLAMHIADRDQLIGEFKPDPTVATSTTSAHPAHRKP
jgi:hypothetical protein